MLMDCLGTTEEFVALFSNSSVLQKMLRFEVALARCQGRLGDYSPKCGRCDGSNSKPEQFDASAIEREARNSASVAIPFVHALRRETGTEFAHWGSTSQDVIDTTLVLLLAEARIILMRDHDRLRETLRTLSEEHKSTVMLARTLMQPALPMTFGYKVALWYGNISRSWQRLNQSVRQRPFAAVRRRSRNSGCFMAIADQRLQQRWREN